MPRIRKAIVYLDTSTISHMARAAMRGQGDGCAWLRLRNALTDAVRDEIICCPVSGLVEQEGELCQLSNEIRRLARELGIVGFKSQLGVGRAQIFRAFERFRAGQPPQVETDPPVEDALDDSPHGWNPIMNIHVLTTPIPGLVEKRRSRKTTTAQRAEAIFRGYEQDGLDYEAIRVRKLNGLGRALIEEMIQSAAMRHSPEAVLRDSEGAAYLLKTTLELLIFQVRQSQGVSADEAVDAAVDFARSPHAQTTASSQISASLYAALAMKMRGPTGRVVRASDMDDVKHLATYLPYCDVFIADRFFASLCNEPMIRLGERFDCRICSLGENDIDGFIQHLQALTRAAPHAELAHRIHEGIVEGGYHQEVAERMRRYLDNGDADNGDAHETLLPAAPVPPDDRQ
ncbi:MAG: hypothetical protein NTW87_21775 [Planctomycetota bacterium]|nr:hypothetical protein [Planctomycetota bacterium]